MSRRKTRAGAALAAVLAASACAGGGDDAMLADRFNYNEAVAASAREQLLLNIVRLRYRDPVAFLEVSSVVTQYVESRTGGLSTALGLDDGPFAETLGLSASVRLEERPTISYAPLQGADYAERLLSPIAPETIFLLSQAGWSLERLMLCCVDSFGEKTNARSATGPTPDILPDNASFRSVAADLRALQTAGAYSVDIETAEGTGEDAPSSHRVVLSFRFDGREGARARALADRIELPADRPVLEVTDVVRDQAASDAFLIRGRAFLGVLYALSQAVEVPSEHVAAGFVTTATPQPGGPQSWEEVLGGIFRVSSSDSRPDNAFVAVAYRDHWFYIPDDDLDAKSTFDLIGHIFALQTSVGDGRTPLLTINAG